MKSRSLLLIVTLFGMVGCQPATELPRVRLERAILLLDRRKPDHAIEMLDRLADETPDNPAVFYNRAVAYEQLGELDRAVADYTQALAIDDRYSAALNNRGVVYARMNQSDKAITDLEALIELVPDDAAAWVNLGLVHQKRKEFAEAERAYQRAASIAPDAELHYLRGCLALDQQKYSDADQEFSSAITADPKMIKAFTNRGLARMYLERVNEAIADLQQARELDEDLEFSPVIDVLLRSATKSVAANKR